jgi:hypothetical protein
VAELGEVKKGGTLGQVEHRSEMRDTAEILRLKGELLLKQNGSNIKEVERYFQNAMRSRASRAPSHGTCGQRRVWRDYSIN